MKKILSMMLVLALAFALTVGNLFALGTVAFADESPTTEPPATQPTEASTTQPSATQPTTTGPTTTQPTTTEPTTTEPTTTEPTATEPTTTEPTATEPTTTEPTTTEPTATEAPSTEPTVPPTNSPTNPPTNPPTTPPTSNKPIITKHPTGENVREGGYAEFVARADSCLDIIWHLQNPGGSIDVLAEKAPERFPGLIVTGLNSERLGLDRIPKALDEWRVRAEFVGLDGNVWSDPAVISVMNQELTAPTIQQQPTSANLKPTEGTTLQISALTSEQNTTLTYQWYKNTINSNVGGKAILGATSASFTPDYEPGTTYYYCAVRCTNGSEISAATKTTCAAVTYITTQGQESTAPTQATTPTATVSPTASTLTPWGEATATEETLPTVIPDAPTRSNSLLLVVVGMIILIAILGIVATVIILKLYSGDRQETPRRSEPPKRPAAPAASSPRRASQSREAAHTPKFAAKQPPADEDPAWDDLSDLGDLSIYFDDEDDPE